MEASSSRAGLEQIEADETTVLKSSIASDEDSTLPMPVLLEKSFPDRRWEKSRTLIAEEPLLLPAQVRRRLARLQGGKRTQRVWGWLHGPQPPRELRIRPLFARIEGVFDRLFRTLRSPLVIFPFLFVWIIGMAELVKLSTFSAETSAGSPTWITGTSSYWLANADCGLDGTGCAPFSNTTLAFRCPSNTVAVQLLNNRAVGPDEVIFQPLIVGGGDPDATYRGDSFICQSAIHYGLFKNGDGGCGVVEQIGNFTDFVPVTRNGLSSVAFPTFFPSAYRFSSLPGTRCKDLRDEILIYNVLMLFIFSFVIRPPTIVLFWTMVCAGFWHESLTLATSINDIADAFGKFLPVLFASYAIWRCAFRWVLPHFNVAILERSILLFAGFWPSVISDQTWERLPLQRLLPQDIAKEPGALATLIVLTIIIVILAITQLWYIRLAGWLPYYFTCYAVGAIVVGLLTTAPDLTLRLHHYIFALILIPLTGFPTRISLLLAGLLLGFFLSGIAEWNWDSILQTASQLRQDASQGTDLPAFVNTSSTFDRTSSTLAFASIPSNLSSIYDGFALIVDDVLLQEGSNTTFSLSSLNTSLPHYFRLAYTFGGSIGDFCRAATWYPMNGTWIDPQSGPS